MILYSYEPHPTNIDLVRVGVRCCECRSFNQFDVHEADWFNGLDLRSKGSSMQDAFPTLTRSQRELLISRICPLCFDRICHD